VRQALHVVWFKRDLRVHDHAPLTRACASGPTLALYAYEPELLAQPDCAVQHTRFASECVAELAQALHTLGVALHVTTGNMPDVLERIQRHYGIAALHSHEETGNAASYTRDMHVAQWCRKQGIPWHEEPNNGVVRCLEDRNRWSALWMQRMTGEPLAPPQAVAHTDLSTEIIAPPEAHGHGTDKPQRQRGGRAQALALLESFMVGRGDAYRAAMSSPLSAQDACSRLSPYLAYGVISVREVVHRVWQARAQELSMPLEQRRSGWLASLKSFESRLHWHCHFIQKLESDPSIETRNMHRAYDGLREASASLALLDAWANGHTGFPMVDACMRMLHATGWINFRMRAMLVSFVSYQLWQPWQPAALHLAREFLDYEPGIHYPQMQMQSGTTGINTIRMYNPVKQARDHDPNGTFVRRWIAPLARVPQQYIFEPWKMPQSVQQHSGCVIGRDYPAPVVDLAQAARRAREAMWAVRRGAAFKREAQSIYVKHGSRNPSREGVRHTRQSAPDHQLSLELEPDA
jgi:deoxyribodipyrimidine photo-lyase